MYAIEYLGGPADGLVSYVDSPLKCGAIAVRDNGVYQFVPEEGFVFVRLLF